MYQFTVKLFIIFFLYCNQPLNAQKLVGVGHFGQEGKGKEYNNTIAISNSGKNYIAGSFIGTIAFDNGTINNSVALSGYIAEFLDNGSVNYITDLPQASVTAMTLTSDGDFLVTGFLNSNNDTLLGTYVSFDSNFAFYIARISPDGKLKRLNIAKSNYGAVDLSALHQKADGGILLGFKFFRDFTINGSEILTGNGRYTGLGLAELDPTTGEMKKMIRLSNTTGSFPKIIGIKSDDKNNIFLYGQLAYQNKIFDADVDAGDKFAFTAKLNDNFEKIWLKHYPNSENNFSDAMDMKMDKNYNMYITGNFRGGN